MPINAMGSHILHIAKMKSCCLGNGGNGAAAAGAAERRPLRLKHALPIVLMTTGSSRSDFGV